MDEIQKLVEKNLINESNVVCCNLIVSVRQSIAEFDFDYVIIDEAPQASQINTLIPLIHNPAKLILLGDDQQLDATSPKDFEPTYQSTLLSMYSKFLKKEVQHVKLNTQFRMNRFISEFVNEEFYKGKIETILETEKNTSIKLHIILTPIMFIDVKDGCESEVEIGSTFKNIKEADVIETILYNLKKQEYEGSQIGVITPYKGQTDILRKRPKSLGYKGVRVSCVDSFQGTERDIIIFSLVRTNRNGEFGFITNRNRINVSLTRARKVLIIVGNFNVIKNSNKYGTHPENDNLIQLCNYYEKLNAVIDSRMIKKIDSLNDVYVINSRHLNKLPDKKQSNDDDDLFYENDNIIKPIGQDVSEAIFNDLSLINQYTLD